MIYVVLIAKILENYTSYDDIYSMWESNVDNIKVNKLLRERSCVSDGKLEFACKGQKI